MAFRRTRFRRRRKKRLAWVGSLFAQTFELDEDVGTTAFELVEPFAATDNPKGLSVDCVLERVILSWNVINTQLLITSTVTMYLAVLETNLNLLPLAYIPDTFDFDYWAKRDTMWMQHFPLASATSPGAWFGTMPPAGAAAVGEQGNLINNGIPLDIRVKRRVRGGEGLYLVMQTNAVPTGEVGALAEVTGWCRALYSFGRK